MSKVKIELEGNNHEINAEANGPVILEQALEAGLDAPYSCQGGVCTTCKARLLEGKVSMDTNFALTDEEVKEGYILTCQSHPTTEEVSISYDRI